jgi:mannitol 2-dehydrogenase
MTRLSEATLPTLGRRLEVPTYDRSRLRSSIMHIGVGAFHRAHQAAYLDDVARAGSTDWGEIGVSLRSSRMRSALLSQDCLFTCVELESSDQRARVLGSMTDHLFGPDDPLSVIRRLADPQTKLVTMTITGDGYNIDGADRFRSDERSVLHDVQHPHTPGTWFGYIAEALSLRRRAGLGGFTVLSCDNLPDNGAAVRNALVSFASLRDETLARWIERNVSFPSSMVDRITPEPNDALQRLLSNRFGVDDRAPVATEPFSQWVVEDEFCEGRPPWDDVGVQLVSDASPYKLVKTRLLNGTHTAMAYLGSLAGCRTTAELCSRAMMRAFVLELMRTEIAPTLPRVPGMDPEAYVGTVMERLDNPSITDPLTRLCRRGSTKVPTYLLPSLIEARRQGLRAPLLTLALAAWFRYLRGSDLTGRPIDITDSRCADLQRLARRGGRDPGPLLSERSVMGELADDLGVRRDLRAALWDLEEKGVEAAVKSRLPQADGRECVTAGCPVPVTPDEAEADLIS